MIKLRILAALGVAALALTACRGGEQPLGDDTERQQTDDGMGMEPVAPGSDERTAFPGQDEESLMNDQGASPNAPGTNQPRDGGTGIGSEGYQQGGGGESQVNP